MTFNYCISNPAFNIATNNNIAGTGGNTTLYKTATRNDFNNRLINGGTLINITLKGIISDLTSGYFKDYQVNFIHLMDNIDVWSYNTCFFSVSKVPRTSAPKILGGLAAKIFSPDPCDCFPFTYYSGSNNGMNKLFGPGRKNKVIRQLPGRNRDSVSYDYTDQDIPRGPKFAFYVMESKKSYSVTSEPICGGTICYIPTSTIKEAEKLKLFVEKNPIFREYVKRMKFRGHAFGLRHIRKFDLSQIETGLETPIEWNITDADMIAPIKLENNITEDRDRVKALGEVFTPTSLVNYVLDLVNEYDISAFTDPANTFIDSMCGDGQFLIGISNMKISNSISSDISLSTIFGIDLTQTNIDDCINRLSKFNNSFDFTETLICADSLGNLFTNKL
jgi:hypothetical protein